MANAKGVDDNFANILKHEQGAAGDTIFIMDQQDPQVSTGAARTDVAMDQERPSHRWFKRRHEDALRDRLKGMQTIARRQAYSEQQYRENIREFVDLCIQCSGKK